MNILTSRERSIIRKCFSGSCSCLGRGKNHEAANILESALVKCNRMKSEIDAMKWLYNDRLDRITNGPPKVKAEWKAPFAPNDSYKLEAFHDGDEWILSLTNDVDVINVDWPFETSRAWDCDLKKLGFEVIQ